MEDSVKNTYPKIDVAISKPLTNNRSAEALKHNIEILIDAGIDPDVSDLWYIKLNKYEQEEMHAEELIKLEDEVYAYD